MKLRREEDNWKFQQLNDTAEIRSEEELQQRRQEHLPSLSQ